MKILQVCSIFPPQPEEFASGVTQVAYHISKELIKRGHTVEVWAANTLDMKTRIDTSPVTVDGIEVRYFSYIARYYTFFLTPSLFKEARCRISEFDVVHIHDFRTFGGAVVSHYARKRSIPYVVQVGGSLPRLMALKRLKMVYDAVCGNKLLRNAIMVVAVTKAEVEQYKAMGVCKDRIALIPNGIDLSEFRDLPERGQFRKKYGLDSNEKLVLYVGRIHKIKSPDLLVEAFARLAKNRYNAKLAIVGPDDGYLQTVKKLVEEQGIEEKVLFTGPLYGQEKLEAYVDANVYVLPSSYEIFGITVIEALACGIPVIVTDDCGLADVLDGQAGLVVPHERDALCDAIASILVDEERGEQFGETGRLLVLEKYNWQKTAERIEETYSQCCTR
ncbi:MAG: glycosyltransferase [Dehalococcoidia bacterium]|nr:glycosyltransferase [Dehalococcoidia bacterium]